MSQNQSSSGGFTIYDAGFSRMTPDTSTKARMAAVKFEDSIRHDSTETGAFFHANGSLIIKKTGMPNSVQFSAVDLNGTDTTLFTHNHPNDMSFSMPDVKNAIDQRLVELRAVGPSIRYIMRPSHTWPSSLSIHMAVQAEAAHVQKSVQGSISNGQLSIRYANLEIQHLIWARVAGRLGFTYIREAS